MDSVLIFHTVDAEGKRGLERGSKVNGRGCRQGNGKNQVFFSELLLENIDTLTIGGDPEG
jgi:hypothetical protein